MWQWNNWLRAESLAEGRRCVMMNLDESPIPVTFQAQNGTTVAQCVGSAWHERPKQNISRKDRRTFFTLLSIVCDDRKIQPILPQLLIVGEKLVTLDELDALQLEMPDNMYIKRRGKGWNTADLFVEYLQLLAAILQPHGASVRFILTLDAVPCHLEKKVLDAIGASLLMWFLLIPAKLTWLLQPLDVYGFSKVKHRLRQGYQLAILDGDQSKPAMLMIRIVLAELSRTLNLQPWRKYFRCIGLWDNRTCVRKFIKKQLAIETVPAILAVAPQLERLKLCWPSNRTVHLEEITVALPVMPFPAVAIVLPALPAAPVHALPGAELPAAPAVPVVPAVLFRRLNSKRPEPAF